MALRIYLIADYPFSLINKKIKKESVEMSNKEFNQLLMNVNLNIKEIKNIFS